MHHDEKGKISPARSKMAKSMRSVSPNPHTFIGNVPSTHKAHAKGEKVAKIESGRAKHVGRAAGVKSYTEAGRRLKKFIPQR